MGVANILTICLPTLTVLVGILLHRSDANRLDARITTEIAPVIAEIAALRADIASIRNDQREFYRTLGGHELRIEDLEKK